MLLQICWGVSFWAHAAGCQITDASCILLMTVHTACYFQVASAGAYNRHQRCCYCCQLCQAMAPVCNSESVAANSTGYLGPLSRLQPSKLDCL